MSTLRHVYNLVKACLHNAGVDHCTLCMCWMILPHLVRAPGNRYHSPKGVSFTSPDISLSKMGTCKYRFIQTGPYARIPLNPLSPLYPLNNAWRERQHAYGERPSHCIHAAQFMCRMGSVGGGTCGGLYNGDPSFSAGGQFAKNAITGIFVEGETINVTVRLFMKHLECFVASPA